MMIAAHEKVDVLKGVVVYLMCRPRNSGTFLQFCKIDDRVFFVPLTGEAQRIIAD